jgi:methanogen extracellular protein (TIGR04279 family)
MRIAVLMLVVLGIYAAGAYDYALPASPGSLALEGAVEVLMPQVSLVAPGGNWTYPYEYYPVYTQNKTISGNLSEPERLAGSKVGVAALRLNTSSFQEALKGLSKLAVSGKVELLGFSAPLINRTGKGHFTMPGMPPGLYALVVANLSSLAVTTALPMLITNDQISIESPDKVKSGDSMLVKIRVLEGQRNVSRKYAAALVSWADYKAIGIRMSSNGSKVGMTSKISIGNESLEVLGEPKISQSLAEKLLPIIPQDSAVAMDESNKTESEMYLLTDSGWKPGRYVLTCGVYSNRGLDGIGQKIIEMS